MSYYIQIKDLHIFFSGQVCHFWKLALLSEPKDWLMPLTNSNHTKNCHFPNSYAATETIFGTSNLLTLRSQKAQEDYKISLYNVITYVLHSKI